MIKLKKPAIIVTKDDTFQRYGEVEIVKNIFEKRIEAYQLLGATNLIEELVMIDLSNLENEKVNYIINRAKNYTLNGFIPRLIKESTNPNFSQWIEDEMKQFPID